MPLEVRWTCGGKAVPPEQFGMDVRNRAPFFVTVYNRPTEGRILR